MVVRPMAETAAVSVHRLLIIWRQILDPFGRSGHRGIINLFGSGEVVSNFLEATGEFGVTNGFSESLTVAEQHGLKLVHHHVGYKPGRVESITH